MKVFVRSAFEFLVPEVLEIQHKSSTIDINWIHSDSQLDIASLVSFLHSSSSLQEHRRMYCVQECLTNLR